MVDFSKILIFSIHEWVENCWWSKDRFIQDCWLRISGCCWLLAALQFFRCLQVWHMLWVQIPSFFCKNRHRQCLHHRCAFENDTTNCIHFRYNKMCLRFLYTYYIYIAGWWFGTWILFFHILGMSSSQLLLTPSFFRGVGGSTTNQIDIYRILSQMFIGNNNNI